MKAALAQIAPVLLNRAATTTKIVEAVEHAAARGASLAVFGETLLPGYPLWSSRGDGARFDALDQKELHARYLDQAVQIERGDLNEICHAAELGNTWIVVGIAEKPLGRWARAGRS